MKSIIVLYITALAIIVSCDSSTKNQVNEPKTSPNEMKPNDPDSERTMEIAMTFMNAMGKGEMEKMMSLMHEDMVWQNAGDSRLPWIGPWEGKKAILEEFLPAFGSNFETIKWEPNDAFANGNTAVFFGQMIGLLTRSGQQTQEFSYALRVKLKDEKVILWNWFEDSYEVSKAFHNK